MKTKALFFSGIMLIVMLLLLTGLFACKGKSSGDKPKNNSGVKQIPAESLMKLRFRPKWHPQAQFSGIYMAMKKGFYRDYGLDVEIQDAMADGNAVESLLAGEGDIIHIDLLTALKLNRDSTVVVNIGQVSQISAVLLVGRKSRGIRSLEDFQGKKLGLWRSGSNIITLAYLAEHNINMQIIYIDWSINLFTQNVVDVINVMQYNEYHQLLQAGIPEDDLFVLTLDAPGYDIPDEGFYVSPDFYQAHPKACQAFTEATMDGWTYAITHNKETVEEVIGIMRVAKLRANKAHQSWILQEMKKVVMARPDELGKLSKKNYQNAYNIMKRMGKITRAIPYEEFYPRGTQ